MVGRNLTVPELVALTNDIHNEKAIYKNDPEYTPLYKKYYRRMKYFGHDDTIAAQRCAANEIKGQTLTALTCGFIDGDGSLGILA